jgi:hypothetical protein
VSRTGFRGDSVKPGLAHAARGGEVAVFRLALQLRAAGTSKRPLIRTPRTCPRSGRWTFTYLPRYDPPYGVQRSTSSMRCSLH